MSTHLTRTGSSHSFTSRAGHLIALAAVVPLALSACGGGTEATDARADGAINQDAHDMLPPDIQNSGTITVAINPEGPPIKYLDEDNKMDGVIVDLVDESAERLGLDVEYAQTTFDGLIPGIMANRFQMIASIGDYAERHEQLDIVDYMVKGVSIAVNEGNPHNIETPEDLCGLSVAFVRGVYAGERAEATSEECTASGNDPITLVPLENTAATELALQSEQVDAEWGDSPNLEYRSEVKSDMYEIVHFEEVGPYGIGFPKESELTEAFRTVLLDMADDGTFEDIMNEWGLGESRWDDFPINQGPEQS